jgi:D-xylose transport system substrate-binding protein
MARKKERVMRGIVGQSSLAAAVLILAVAAVAGCGESKSGTIALLLPDQGVPLLKQDYREFEKKVEDLCSGCTVVYRDAEGGVVNQREQAEAALTHGADVLVVDPVEPDAASEIVQKAKLQKVPVVSYNRLIVNARVDYYVGVEEEEAGKLQGRALAKRLKEEGKPQGPIVNIPVGFGGRLNIGAHDAFNSGGLKVVKAYSIEKSSTLNAEIEMRKAIEELGPNDFAGVYASDDDMAWGVIEAMEFTGVDPAQKPITGGGATVAALQRMLEGKQYMTVYEATKEQAQAAAEVAVELVKGNEVPNSWITDEPANGLGDVPSVLLKPTAVTKDTIDKTVVANGFVDPAQLCAGKYSRYCQEDGIPTQPK